MFMDNVHVRFMYQEDAYMFSKMLSNKWKLISLHNNYFVGLLCGIKLR